MSKSILSLLIAALLLTSACGTPRITRLAPDQGAPDAPFVIHGEDITNGDDQPFLPPEMRHGAQIARMRNLPPYASDRLNVKVSPELDTPGYHQVTAAGPQPGAYEHRRTEPVPFLVLAPGVAPNFDDPWAAHVKSFRVRYGKSAEWEQWMLDHRGRYNTAFTLQRARQWPVNINVRYRNDVPVPYATPWPTEELHVQNLHQLISMTFYGFEFNTTYNRPEQASPNTIDVFLNAHGSGAHPTFIDLQWETVIGHELGHMLGIYHHYDDSDISTIIEMPPGEDLCIMARRGAVYCSACRTAMGIPLDIDNNRQVETVINEIFQRYPPDWGT